jgi:hypothetical protein
MLIFRKTKMVKVIKITLTILLIFYSELEPNNPFNPSPFRKISKKKSTISKSIISEKP